MTEFTDEQLCLLVNKLAPIVGESKALILTEELRPAPKYGEGQVLWDERCLIYRALPDPDSQCRALTIPEMGPLVQGLRESVFRAVRYGETSYLEDALDKFDEVHNA